MVRNPWPGVLVLFVLVMALHPPATAQTLEPSEGPDGGTCTNFLRGSILVPTGTQSPPWPLTLINVGQVGNIYTYIAWVEPVGQNQKFYLSPAAGTTHLGTWFPEFRMAFVKNDQVISVVNDPAPVTGHVPSTADSALIWMRVGPDSPLASDNNPFGGEFVYGDSCQGPPSWYLG